MTDIVAVLHNFDDAAFFAETIKEYGQVTDWFSAVVPVSSDLTSTTLSTSAALSLQTSMAYGFSGDPLSTLPALSLNNSILSSSPSDPPSTPTLPFHPAALVYVRIEGKSFNKAEMIQDKHIRSAAQFVFINENKIRFDSSILKEAGVSAEAFREFRKGSPTLQGFLEFYEGLTDKETFLYRLLKLIALFSLIKYNPRTAQRCAALWFDRQEADPPVLFQVGREIDRLADEDLTAINNLLIMKEKLILWCVGQTSSPLEKYEIFGPLFSRLTQGFQFVNEKPEVLQRLVRLVFLNYVGNKSIFSDRIPALQVSERLGLLNGFFGIDISGGYAIAKPVLTPRNFRLPEDLSGLDRILQPALNEAFNTFLGNTDAQLEQCVSSAVTRRNKWLEFNYRLTQVQFWLTFNQSLKYQNRLLGAFKLLRDRSPAFPAVKEKVEAMELQFFMQMKYHRNAVVLLLRLVAHGHKDAGVVLRSLRETIPDNQIKSERLEEDVLRFTGMEVRTSQYQGTKFQLFLDLTVDFPFPSPLTVTDFVVSFHTNKPETLIQSTLIPSLTFSPDTKTVGVTVQYDEAETRALNYFTIADISFRIADFPFLGDLASLSVRNVNLEELPVLWVNSSGFLNKLTDGRVFFEKNSANFFFVEFSLFDHKSPTLADLRLDLFRSSKYVIIHSEALLVKGEEVWPVTFADNQVVLPRLRSGRYVLLLRVYLLYSKIKNYELSLRANYHGRSNETKIALKEDHEKYFYMENEIVLKGESFWQLRVWNESPSSLLRVHRVEDRKFDPPRELLEGEEISLILEGKEEFVLEYDFDGISFARQPIHQALQVLTKGAPREPKQNGSKLNGTSHHDTRAELWGSSPIHTDSRIRGVVSVIERFVFNRDMEVRTFEIKGRKDVQVYEQSQFIFSFRFGTESLSDGKRIFVELDWDQTKYCVLGKTKFELQPSDKVRTKEVTFIPYDSGFLNFPRILLIEQRDGLPEIKHLINKPSSQKSFFVKEGITRSAKLE